MAWLPFQKISSRKSQILDAVMTFLLWRGSGSVIFGESGGNAGHGKRGILLDFAIKSKAFTANSYIIVEYKLFSRDNLKHLSSALQLNNLYH